MTDELERAPALATTIAPLPGGLEALRQRLREPMRPRTPIALALAATACATIALWLLRATPPPAADRSALRRLLVDSAELPHPRAVELGLVDRARPVVAPDPRVEPSDAVVFYWVPPANP
jgi:hypothetical protein